MSNGQEGGRNGSFRLPRPTFGLFFPIVFGPIVIGPRRRPPRAGGLSALPQAVPQPPPFSPPPTFPGGPAANDPIFKKALSRRIPIASLGRLLGLGGLIVTAAEILVKVIEKRQLDRMGDILADQDRVTARINIEAIIERELRKKLLRAEKKVRALESAPETLEIPEVEPPPAPLRRIAPEIFPDVFPATTTPFPVPSPVPIEVPGPVAPTVPRPAPVPLPAPLPFPVPRTFPLGLPAPLPIFFPRFTPVGDPQLLTPFQSTPLPSPGTGPTSQFAFSPDPRLQPQLSPQTDPEQRCKRRCDDRENRTQCFKGLFRESTSSIDFTDWQEVDCITGRDIESTGVSGRITSEVVELF